MGFIRIAYRWWFSYSDDGCLPTESLRIQQSFSPRDCLSQLVFCIQQNPEAVDCNTSEGMGLLSRACMEKQAAFFHIFYRGWARSLKVDLLTSKIQIKSGNTSNYLIEKNIPHKCAQTFGFQLTPDVVKLTTKARHPSATHLPGFPPQ